MVGCMYSLLSLNWILGFGFLGGEEGRGVKEIWSWR